MLWDARGILFTDSLEKTKYSHENLMNRIGSFQQRNLVETAAHGKEKWLFHEDDAEASEST